MEAIKNQIAWLIEPERFVIEDAPIPEIGEDEVLVKVEHVGICGSDMAFFKDPTLGGRFHPQLPMKLGHECGGIIVQKGKRVGNLQIGDKVALDPGEPCGRCEYCMSGRYNLCRDVNFMAATPFKRGALSRYLAYPARMSFRLEEEMTTLDGAMMEPLSVGLHAAKRGGVGLGKSIVILGGGCIGLMTMMACQALGATHIIVADILENRLEIAKRFGARHVINSSKKDLQKAVMEITGGDGADVVFETAGIAATAKSAAEITKIGGRIVLVGQIHEPVLMDLFAFSRKEIDLVGSFRYANTYPAACQAIADGLPVSELVTSQYPFEKVQEAFETAIHRKQTEIKVAITF